MFQSPGSIAFSFGSVQIHWYGIIIACAILLCYGVVFLEMRRRKLEMEPIDSMAFWLIAAGIIGARLYYVIFNLNYYLERPLDILQVWKGGLAIHGALIGGALAYFIFVHLRKIKWPIYADIFMPGILLAQAVGRFGNFFNNEAFGTPTDLPWKLYIPEDLRPTQFVDFSYFHPTFLYESIWNLVGFIILFFLARMLYKIGTTRKAGLIFSSYFIWYSFGRFFVEALRTDSLLIGQIRVAQLASILLFFVGIFSLLFFSKKDKI